MFQSRVLTVAYVPSPSFSNCWKDERWRLLSILVQVGIALLYLDAVLYQVGSERCTLVATIIGCFPVGLGGQIEGCRVTV